MAWRDIRIVGDPVLRTVCAPIVEIDDRVRALVEDPEVRTLVMDDEGPAAYVMFIIDRAYETAEMLSLAVLPDRRRRGLGRMLIGEMEREAGGGAHRGPLRPYGQSGGHQPLPFPRV